ncbi:prophage tail fiber N-terminal domain-containing protein [Serratia fonticola]
MSILVDGILKSSAGNVIGNADIVLTAISTSLVVLGGTPLSIKTDADGRYSFTLHNGNYAVSVSRDGNNWFSGMITVTDLTVPKSINALLLQDSMMAEIPVDYWSYFQAQTGILFTNFEQIDNAINETNNAKEIAIDAKNKTVSAKDVAVIARNDAETFSQIAQSASDAYASVAEAQAAINSGAETRRFFAVKGEGDTWAYRYENVNGVATNTGEALPSSELVGRINEIVFTEETATPLAYLSDVLGNNYGVFLADGSFHLLGMSGALQDQYAITHVADIKNSVSKSPIIDDLSSIVSGDETNAALAVLRAQDGNDFLAFSPDGGAFFRGFVGALQDQYALNNAGKIKDAVGSIGEMKVSLEAKRPVLIDRVFHAMNKNGELVSQAIRVARITRKEHTGYKLNSWPQGKLCVDSMGRIYCGYNSTNAHGGSGGVPVLTYSDDRGVSWSDPVYVVLGENFARGTDWWSLGVDDQDHLWGVVRSRGANNQVGVTFHNLYKSTDRGITWQKLGELTAAIQMLNDVDYVPELYHDMCYVKTTGRMITGYHFANSSRVGFLSFDITDPLNTAMTHDIIAHGEFSTTVYCEPTIAIEYDRASSGTVYGGLRTQTTGNPSQLYFMNSDMSGFTRFDAPESVQYSPMTIRRINGQFILLTIERFNTGVMNLWFGTPFDFYSKTSSNFWKMPVGKIVEERISGASNVGVQDMEIFGDNLYFSWSHETNNSYADNYFGRMNIVTPASLMNYDYLEGL